MRSYWRKNISLSTKHESRHPIRPSWGYSFLFGGAPVTVRQEARRKALECFPFLSIIPEDGWRLEGLVSGRIRCDAAILVNHVVSKHVPRVSCWGALSLVIWAVFLKSLLVDHWGLCFPIYLDDFFWLPGPIKGQQSCWDTLFSMFNVEACAIPTWYFLACSVCHSFVHPVICWLCGLITIYSLKFWYSYIYMLWFLGTWMLAWNEMWFFWWAQEQSSGFV